MPQIKKKSQWEIYTVYYSAMNVMDGVWSYIKWGRGEGEGFVRCIAH
jgi:hypothetical protein